MNIPYLDLKSQYISIKPEIDSAVRGVFRNMQFIGGTEVAKFESEFASFLTAKHVISVNSGTDALILGMKALDLSPGDELIVPVNTFYATASAIVENNLKPVFVDTDTNFGISLADLKRKITPKTKAIIAVHLFGQPDDIGGIMGVIKASRRRIHLIEDACQAPGATYQKHMVGTFGIFSAFSFYPSKNLGAYGDGGAIVTNDGLLAKKCRLLREYGQTSKYLHETYGRNSRLDSLQAAILRKKLVHLVSWNECRREHARQYNDFLNGCAGVVCPKMLNDRKSVFHIYPLRVKNRRGLQAHLKRCTIGTLIHYPIPLHLSGAFSYLGFRKGDFPVAEAYAGELLSLPMYPELQEKQISYICSKIRSFYR